MNFLYGRNASGKKEESEDEVEGSGGRGTIREKRTNDRKLWRKRILYTYTDHK